MLDQMLDRTSSSEGQSSSGSQSVDAVGTSADLPGKKLSA
jgi:hypothetical protein